jgi:hypothetical protein
LDRAGRKTLAQLRAKSPTAIFTVVPVAENVGQEGVVAGCFPRWRIGNIYIRGRPGASTDSTALHVTLAGGNQDLTLPLEAMFGLARAMPFWEVLQNLQKLVQSPTETTTPLIQEAMTLAFTCSIVATIADRVQDAMGAKSHDVEKCMVALEMWRGGVELHHTLANKARWSSDCLYRMLGVLSALASVIHSIFSTQRRLIAKRLR